MALQKAMSALLPKADVQCTRPCLLWAKSALMQRSKNSIAIRSSRPRARTRVRETRSPSGSMASRPPKPPAARAPITAPAGDTALGAIPAPASVAFPTRKWRTGRALWVPIRRGLRGSSFHSTPPARRKRSISNPAESRAPTVSAQPLPATPSARGRPGAACP